MMLHCSIFTIHDPKIAVKHDFAPHNNPRGRSRWWQRTSLGLKDFSTECGSKWLRM
jgi:hypothetical protein